MARFTKTLPAGRYAAFYATDDSHDPSGWNSAPPHDPQAWGLLIRVLQAEAGDAAPVKTFAYEHVPANATIVALTKVGDSESRSRGFTLNRAMDVRVYALGEGRTDRLVDYGWITSVATHQKVWEMRYADTEPAGGDAKNRMVDRTIHLEKGDYVVHYVSDDSHSYDDWNAAAPSDGQHWGITLLAAQGPLDRSPVSEYAEKADPSVIAQIVRVRDDENPRKTLQARSREPGADLRARRGQRPLARRLRLDRGRAHREDGVGDDLPDHRARGRRRQEPAVRRHRSRSRPASTLLRYESDGSHSFGSWNASPPDDPDMWGITVYRVK